MFILIIKEKKKKRKKRGKKLYKNVQKIKLHGCFYFLCINYI